MWILSFNNKGVEMNRIKDFLLNFIYTVAGIAAATLVMAFALWLFLLLLKTFIEWLPPYGWLLRGLS